MAERMTEYIVRRGLLPGSLMAEVWVKWSALERPSELRDNPEYAAWRTLPAPQAWQELAQDGLKGDHICF